jgi:hypothetical protein
MMYGTMKPAMANAKKPKKKASKPMKKKGKTKK